jgi:gliding motility-associated-like protein
MWYTFRIAIISLVLVLAAQAHSQNQANNWFFGNFAGLDFSSGEPVPTNIGQIAYFPSSGTPTPLSSHNEGTSSISDVNGSLLYYSNGLNLYNSNHQVTPNGSDLFGNVSSTQSSVFVPDPANPSNIFYLFTMGSLACCGQSNFDFGLRYSKIDNCLDNENGDIISGQKNIPLMNGLTEKMAVVRHANGVDYWLVTHKNWSNEFISMRITATGIVDTVSSFLGSVHQSPFNPLLQGSNIGQMKISPNGEKLALGSGNGNNLLEVFDFNTTTGVVSNTITIFTHGSQLQTYGVEFSPNSSILYTYTATGGQSGTFVYQYDLTSNNQSAIVASQTTVYNVAVYNYRGIQIGPDNKLYIPGLNSTIHRINDPDVLGVGCNFQANAIQLLPGTLCSYTLPTFIAGFDYSNEVVDCPSNNPDFTFSLGPDISICPEGSVTISAPPNQLGYLWNTGATSSSITVSEPGTYWVSVTSTNGTASDTIVVSNFVPQNININGELGVCPGNTTDLAASNGFTNCQWNTGEVTQNITVSAGTYWLTANDPNGCLTSDTVSVFEFPSPTITISGNTSVCLGDETTLQANSGFVVYQWSNGSDEATANLGLGTYSITVIDSLGCSASSEITVVSSSPTAGIALNSNFINLENSLNLQSTSSADLFPINTWNWTFGDGNTSDVENPSHNYSAVGNYIITLVITDALGCTDTTFVEIEVLGAFVIPNVVTPNGDGVNDMFFIQNLDLSQANTLVVFNRWGNVVFEVENYQNDWQPNNLVDGVYFYQFTLSQSETKQGFFHVYSGE